MDKLSELPNDIITDIFSRLSLRQVVQTSVLSKRFEHIWQTVGIIEVDTKDILKCPTSMIRELPLKLDKVVFVMSRTALNTHHLTSKIVEWLNLARVRDVDEVRVFWDESLRQNQKGLVVDSLRERSNESIKEGLLSLFQIPTLKKLSLQNPQSISVPNNWILPRLEELTIEVHHYSDLGILLPEPMHFPNRVDISINLTGDQVNIRAFLDLVNAKLLGNEIVVVGRVAERAVFKLEGTNLVFYKLFKPSQAGNLQLHHLRQLDCILMDYSDFVAVGNVIRNCPLLETLLLWIKINFDATLKEQRWLMKIEGGNLRRIKLEGGLYVRRDREIHVELETPNVESFDVVLNCQIQLFIKWNTATPRLLWKRIRPCPASEGDLDGKHVGGNAYFEEEP